MTFTEPKAWASWVHAFLYEEPPIDDGNHGKGASDMTESQTLSNVIRLVTPILADLGLDLYDVEFRGGTLRVTIDTAPGAPGGVNLEQLALATRLIGRDFDHEDPVPGHYTLEVTSPGVERNLRTPAHFQREIGKVVAIRLRDTTHDDRRVQGVLVAADDEGCTVRLGEPAVTDIVADAGADPDADVVDDAPRRVVPYAQIDRAHTVFVWGPQPKPGKQPRRPKSTPAASHQEARAS